MGLTNVFSLSQIISSNAKEDRNFKMKINENEKVKSSTVLLSFTFVHLSRILSPCGRVSECVCVCKMAMRGRLHPHCACALYRRAVRGESQRK